MKTLFKNILLLYACCILATCIPFKKRKETSAKRGIMSQILEVNQKLNSELLEGDIRMTKSEFNAIIDPSEKWPKKIPYEIGEEYEFENVDLIEDVLREISVRTCLQFHERDPDDEFTYFKYKRHNGCSSAVGREGGAQIVSIDTGCEYRGVIQHETLHALGFWHEQSRYDRDDYVEILWENINDAHEFNFVKYSEDEIQTLGAPYDYNSVMHYGPYDFSDNGQPTIRALKEGAENMGQRDHYSDIDWWKLRTLYGCDTKPTGWTEWTSWSRCNEDCRQYRTRYYEKTTNENDEDNVEEEKEYQECSLCIKRVDKDCGRRYSIRQHTTVTSPLYPYAYKLDVECEQVFMSEENERIILEFESIDIESLEDGYCFDWVKVYDGSSTDSKLLGRYCGNNRPEAIVSSGNTLTILFFSDYSVSWQGFFGKISTTSASSWVHGCFFEGGRSGCDWLDDVTADYGWSDQIGKTSSSSTGPNFDHTTSSDQGQYIYVESSSPYSQGQKARVISPYIVTSSSDDVMHCLNFWYMMYGAEMGSLNVYLIVDGDMIEQIFNENGDHGMIWLESKISIKIPSSIYQVAFEGVRGNGYHSDIALDDVIIMPGSCDDDEGSGMTSDW